MDPAGNGGGFFFELVWGDCPYSALVIVVSSRRPGYEPVLFVTLTQPENATLSALFDNTKQWLRDLRNATKCHLVVDAGYEDKSPFHIHMIISIPPSEGDVFHRRFLAYNASDAWKWRADIQAFDLDQEQKCFSYVLDKHIPLKTQVICPKRYWQCRQGRCEHIGKS